MEIPILRLNNCELGLRQIEKNIYEPKNLKIFHNVVNGSFSTKKLQVLMGCQNAEKHLPKMLKSMEACMSGLDWALVTLDDCSDDRTGKILELHPSSCSKRIHMKNESPSGNVNHVKNKLLQLALTIKDQYQYVYMVDGDDEMLAPAITELFNHIIKTDADVIIGSHELIDLENKKQIINIFNHKREKKNKKTLSAIEKALGYNFCFGTWATIFRLESITKNGILFRTKNPAHEDALAYVRMLLNNKKIIFKKTPPVYRHFLREGSVSICSDLEKRYKTYKDFLNYKNRLLIKELPQSFCSLATKECWQEFILMVKTLRRFHNEELIVVGDEVVKSKLIKHNIKNYTFYDLIDDGKTIKWANDAYHNAKAVAKKYLPIEKALEKYKNTIFLDADLIIMAPFDEGFRGDVAATNHHKKDVGPDFDNNLGRWNSGLLYVKDSFFPEWWKKSIITESTFTDQQCLNYADLFSITEMGEHYNVGFWRLKSGETGKPEKELLKELGIKINRNIAIGGKEVKSFHTHLFLQHERFGVEWLEMNRLVKYCLKHSKNHTWILNEYESLVKEI